MASQRRAGVAWIVGLILVAVCAFVLRRAFVQWFFVDGEAGAPPSLRQPTMGEKGLDEVDLVRVVLIDGIGLETAHDLPHLDRVCEAGLDLVVDVGFPTVSLSVQHVLWTGRTQAQSGVMFRIQRVDPPPADAIPARVQGSLAVAESHPEIVWSFGFSEAQPPLEEEAYGALDLTTPWRVGGFPAAAERAVGSKARLAFVHVLRTDEIGHLVGARSRDYRAAARWADELLWRLVKAGGDLEGRARWFVLSDHGHRPGGGHAGGEPQIRKVRACIVGGGGDRSALPSGRELHLVDIHRALLDSLGLEPAAGAMGRPLGFALANPDPGETLPRPSVGRWIAAALVLLPALALTYWGASGALMALPWWVLAAYASLLAIEGPATLSNPMVYPPTGRTMLVAAIPGIVVLAGLGTRAAMRQTVARLVAAQLALLLGLCVGALVLCGAVSGVVGLSDQPPLMPLWTAHASLFLCLCGAGALVLALVLSVVAGVERLRHATGRSHGRL